MYGTAFTASHCLIPRSAIPFGLCGGIASHEEDQQSRAVNYVWNFCNDTQKHALKWDKKWPTKEQV